MAAGSESIREVERQFFAQLGVLLFGDQFLQDFVAFVTALGSEPEGGLFAEVRRVGGFGERCQRRSRGGTGVHG